MRASPSSHIPLEQQVVDEKEFLEGLLCLWRHKTTQPATTSRAMKPTTSNTKNENRGNTDEGRFPVSLSSRSSDSTLNLKETLVFELIAVITFQCTVTEVSGSPKLANTRFGTTSL